MNTVGYVALALGGAILTLAFVTALAAVGLWLKFRDEPERGVGWREAVFGDAERGQ